MGAASDAVLGKGGGGAGAATGAGGICTEAVRRGSATEGGRGAGTDEIAVAAGAGTVGTGVLMLGARMGADLATGSGKLGGVAWVTPRGGETVDVGAWPGSFGFLIGVEGGRAGVMGAGASGAAPRLSRTPEGEGGVGKGGGGVDGTSGGWGATGSGTRRTGAVLVSAGRAEGNGGIGVRAVSFRPDKIGATLGGRLPDSRVIMGRLPVRGSAGGRDSC